jgi:fumarate hydratase subunit beta
MVRQISTPLTKDIIQTLKAGDMINISGTIYTARDAAHKKIIGLIEEGKPLPFDLKDQIIYYVGPCPSPPGKAIGSCGPTTSGRMDAYTPRLIELGLGGMIGKGLRSRDVIESMIKNKAVYFGAIGGVAALIAGTITSQEVICFPELGPESIRKLTVNNFPVIVVIDSNGNNLYEIGKSRFRIG